MIELSPRVDTECERRKIVNRIICIKKGMKGIEELKRKVKSLKSNIRRRDEVIDDMCQKVNNLSAIYKNQKLNLDTLEIDNERMEQRIKETTVEIISRENEIINNKRKYFELKSNYSFITGIESEINNLKKKNKRLTDEIKRTKKGIIIERKRKAESLKCLLGVKNYLIDHNEVSTSAKQKAAEEKALIEKMKLS